MERRTFIKNSTLTPLSSASVSFVLSFTSTFFSHRPLTPSTNFSFFAFNLAFMRHKRDACASWGSLSHIYPAEALRRHDHCTYEPRIFKQGFLTSCDQQFQGDVVIRIGALDNYPEFHSRRPLGQKI